jgi:hypothetical protein
MGSRTVAENCLLKKVMVGGVTKEESFRNNGLERLRKTEVSIGWMRTEPEYKQAW